MQTFQHIFVGRQAHDAGWGSERFGLPDFATVVNVRPADRACRTRGDGIRHDADNGPKVLRMKFVARLVEVHGWMPADRVGATEHIGDDRNVDAAHVPQVGLAGGILQWGKFADNPSNARRCGRRIAPTEGCRMEPGRLRLHRRSPSKKRERCGKVAIENVPDELDGVAANAAASTIKDLFTRVD